jgi:hypothetical protein
MVESLNLDSLLRLLAWMKQRFPLSDAPLFVALYLCASIVARYSNTKTEITLGWLDLFACFVTWSFFLLLRIFDEYADYEKDLKIRPEYTLQSSSYSLRLLKIIGIIIVALQLSYAFFLDQGIGSVTFSWGIMFIWSWISSYREHYGKWLKDYSAQSVLIYYLVMPLNLWWLVQMGSPGVLFDSNIQLLALLSFIVALAFRIAHKTYPPQEECEGLDTYSSIYGPRVAGYLILTMVLSMLSIQAFLAFKITSGDYWLGYLALCFCLLFSAWHILKFCLLPSTSGRKMNQIAVALCVIIGNLVIINAVISERGLVWQFF